MEGLLKEWLVSVFRAAVAAAEPGRLVREALRARADASRTGGAGSAGRRPARRVVLVGGGKAGRAMAEAAAEHFGTAVAAGVLAVPGGAGGTRGPVRYVEAGHPLPDAGSREAAGAMLSLLAGATAEDLVVALLSGGGSSMISAPAPGISPMDKEETSRLLLRSGADIAEFNAVRKHLSSVKGGLMAAAARSPRILALLLSDVPGDDPSVIASGPFAPDPTTFGDAREVLVRHGLLAAAPRAVRSRLDAGVAGAIPETPKPGNPIFARVESRVVGSNRTALEAAAAAASERGPVRILPGFLRGEARDCGRAFVAALREARNAAPPGGAAVVVAGGETTVAARGSGAGGRSQEFVLAAAMAIGGEEGIALLCAGTDGRDGPTDAAGAFADGTTVARARAAGLPPEDHLGRNDSHPFFRALEDLVVTGPTGTNVGDVAVGVAFRPEGIARKRRAAGRS